MAKRLKRPRDPVELGKLIGDILTGQVEDKAPDDGKNPCVYRKPKPERSDGEVRQARGVIQMAEVSVPRELFEQILRLIDGLRPRPAPA
jgi:hypothetical protein